jgi:hypothetical protein
MSDSQELRGMQFTSTDSVGFHAAMLRAIQKAGTQKAFAEKHGMTQAYISRAIIGASTIGPRLIAAVGYRKVVTFIPIQGGES